MNNLSYYHIFLSVANNKNITKASEELFISQPAISKAIQKLEDNLNVRLFLRSTRGVKLTYEGELLYHEITQAFQAIQFGEEQIRTCERLHMGHLTIGVSSTLCKFILLPYLKKYIEKYPHVKISIACQSSYETIALLEKGTIDIGLIGRSQELPGFIYQKIGDITDIFVASPAYLKHMESLPGYQENSPLISSNLMLLNKENITRQYIDEYVHSSQWNPINLIEVTSMDLLIEFAKIGLGSACVIKNFVEEELKSGDLVEIHTGIQIPPREIGFLYKKELQSMDSLHNFLIQ